MSLVSDPSLRAAHREHGRRLDAATRAALTVPNAPTTTARARRGRSRFVFGLLFVGSALLALRALASVVAAPLEVAGAVPAPTRQIEVSTNSDSPGIALAYGPDVGFQLLRIPSREARGTDARVLPARLARGELHLITLSLGRVHVEVPGARGTGVLRMAATSPIVTVFQSSTRSEVRNGW